MKAVRVLLAALTLSLLYMQGRKVRIPQTLAALAGSGTLLGLIALLRIRADAALKGSAFAILAVLIGVAGTVGQCGSGSP